MGEENVCYAGEESDVGAEDCTTESEGDDVGAGENRTNETGNESASVGAAEAAASASLCPLCVWVLGQEVENESRDDWSARIEVTRREIQVCAIESDRVETENVCEWENGTLGDADVTVSWSY